MPSYGGETDSGFGGYAGGGFGGGYSGGGGLDGAPDIGTLGGTYADEDGETSSTLGGGLTGAQSDANMGVNADSWGYDFSAADMNTPNDWSLGQLFGYEQAQGLPTQQGEFMGNESSYGFSDFASSPFGKGLRGLLGMTPFGKVANIGMDMAQGKPLSQVAANAIPGNLGLATRVGLQAYNSPNPMASLGKSALGYGLSQVGGQIGNSISPGIGGMLGSMAGSKVASMAGNAPRGGAPTGGAPSSGGGGGGETGFNMGGLLEGLGGLYSGYRGMKQAGALQDQASQTGQALQGQMTSLANMYGPNSPYATQLAQQLARKDAAAGRNSQYGPRAVELQARLAAMAPQVANSMAGLGDASNRGFTQAAAANQAEQIARGQMLNKLFAASNSSGLTDWASKGLSSLFSNNSAPQEYVYDDTTQWT